MLKDIYAEGGLSLTRAVMEDILRFPCRIIFPLRHLPLRV